MGSSISKSLPHVHEKTEQVDLGFVVPRGIHTFADTHYDCAALKRFIRNGLLAPFYPGLSEPPFNHNDDHAKDSKIPGLDAVKNLVAANKSPVLLTSADKQRWLYEHTVECPICFLYYPACINYSRCCDKPICTECFLQLKRSAETPMVPPSCPFCVQPNFGVIHMPPPFSKKYEKFSNRRQDLSFDVYRERRRKYLGPNDPDVILVDQVRPDWHRMLERATTPNAYRQSRHSGLSGSGSTRRVVVRPDPPVRRHTSASDASTTVPSSSPTNLSSLVHSVQDLLYYEPLAMSNHERFYIATIPREAV
ncbi:hypothetical protein BCR43DRAFT_492845 [Syncephalastrum racemosum]|uniref:RING-type domain-containing protein n=1 Tax=Syncephalastrum racemosum TaxID=13706 RepID=A0A1X2H9M3_SYNRA|nr:hypothetical protein BCR43DRAFT_492845 [Syncephalastrum racemosum]